VTKKTAIKLILTRPEIDDSIFLASVIHTLATKLTKDLRSLTKT